jgi:hypothetical protein
VLLARRQRSGSRHGHSASPHSRGRAPPTRSDVDCLSSILVPADETVFCSLRRCEADVRAASERAGVPFERVLESLRIEGHDQEEA